MSRLKQDLDSRPVQSGLCACGSLGKPFVTIRGSTGFVCFSCFMMEAAGENRPEIQRSEDGPGSAGH